MTVIENVFICITAPLLFSLLCMKRRERRMMVFLLSGMSMCLLSSYISSYLAMVQGADVVHASMEISPLVEEIMKFLPMIFFLMVFEPKKEDIPVNVMMIAVGFATFENICYLMRNGSGHLVNLAIRGFATGAMHVMCGYMVAMGLVHLWDRDWIRVAGTLSLMAVAISYHGIYNILVTQTGPAAVIGYCLPLATAGIAWAARKRFNRKYPRRTAAF
ncbi:MAG: PrsW family intramembrane metalloprotease [Lachnospiraceae bacterium]|nr:PrsW family intramembrane metalloprotease [Lachnospiraceae bacterium]